MTSVVPPYSRLRQLPSREISDPQWTNVPTEQQGSETAVGGPFRRRGFAFRARLVRIPAKPITDSI